MSLSQKTSVGIFWHFAQQLIRRGINFVVTLLLARILAPEDFGLVAMMTVFLTLGSSLMDSGFKQALIRMDRVNQSDYDTVFYANLILGTLAYTFLFFLAPTIAHFYQEPRLVSLVRIAGIIILINSFLVVQSANMHRALNFKAEMQTTIPAGIISSILAVILAYSEFGVWALIIQMLMFAFINTFLLWLKQGWRPSLSFNKSSLMAMYHFSYRIFLSGLLDSIFKNLYIILIAKFFNASITGYYFFAEKIKDMVVNQLVGSIQTVTYPALASLQQDDVLLKKGYRKVIAVSTFVLFPCMMLLAALATPIFVLFLPEKWLPASLYLQLMCFAGLLHPINSINQNLLKVKGRSDIYLKLEILKKIMIVAVFVVSFQYGIIGVLIGQIISSFLVFILSSYFTYKLIQYSILDQVSDFFYSLLLSIFIGASAYFGLHAVDWHPLAEFVVIGIGAVSVYLISARFIKLKAYIMLFEIIRSRKASRVV